MMEDDDSTTWCLSAAPRAKSGCRVVLTAPRLTTLHRLILLGHATTDFKNFPRPLHAEDDLVTHTKKLSLFPYQITGAVGESFRGCGECIKAFRGNSLYTDGSPHKQDDCIPSRVQSAGISWSGPIISQRWLKFCF